MLKLRPALILGAALLACGSVARAAGAPPTPVPDPKPNFASMAFQLGTWQCHSTTRGSTRPNTTVNTMDYDGRWMKGHDIAPPFDKYRTRTIVSDTWTTYNADMQIWVQTTVDNFGGYGIVTSPGWSGNTLTWTLGTQPNGTTGTDVFTKLSATQTRDVFATKDKNGKAQPTVTTLCMKK